MRVRFVAILALIAGTITISGCASSPPPPSSQQAEAAQRDGFSAEQRAALAGGVDRDEYLAGFDRYSACMKDKGYEIEPTGEENESLIYAIPASAVESGDNDECYVREFQKIDIEWQLAHEDTSESTEILRACLAERGIEPEERTEAIVQQLEDAGIDFEECTEE